MAIDLGSIGASITLDASNFINNARSAGDAMQGLQSQSEDLSKRSGISSWITNNSKSLTTLGTGFTVFGGIVTGVMGVAGKVAMDFEAAMSAVASVSGASVEQMERANDVILDIGYQTTLSATEAAAALEILIKAGVELDDALDGIALAAVNLSEATGVDIALAAETAAAAMNIFGYEAEEANRVMDAISQSANASALDVNDWTLALKYAGPIVSALGWDIEDLAEMMVILGDAGIKGEVGATAIRNVLLALSNPTTEITAAFGKYNVALFDTNGNLREMSEITKDLAPAWDEMTQAEKLAFAELVAGKQGVTSFTALMEDQAEAVNENSNAFDRAAKRMRAAGTTQEMAARRMDNLAGSIEELKGTIETLMITFMSGLTPVIRRVADTLSVILQQFLRLPSWVQTSIASIVGLTGVLALLTGSGMLAAVKIVELVDAFKKLELAEKLLPRLTVAVNGLRTAMLGLFANPVLLAGALAIGGLFLAYKTNFMGFGDAVDHALGRLGSFTDAIDILLGKPSTKSFNITTSWDADAHYITETTLEDGTKIWQIKEDETGQTFGEIIESYTDATGTTYILIEPEGDGPDFWAKADLETGKPESIEIPLDADLTQYNLRLTTIQSATGKAVPTVMIDIDGNPVPFGTVIDGIIVDEATGTKVVTLALGNGEEWIAEVDGVTGSIVLVREVKIEADFSDLGAFEKTALTLRAVIFQLQQRFRELSDVLGALAGKFDPVIQFAKEAWDVFNPLGPVVDQVTGFFETLNAILMGDWSSISWESVMDAAGLDVVYEAVQGLVGAYEGLLNIWNQWTGRNDNGPDKNNDGLIEPHEENPGFIGEPALGFAGSNRQGSARALLDGLGGSSGAGDALRDAAAGAAAFRDALTAANPVVAVADANVKKLAATLPPYIGGTTQATTATGAMAGNMNSSFAAIASQATSRFAAMRGAAASETAAMQSTTTSNVSSMANTAGLRISAMQLAAGLSFRGMASDAKTSGTEMGSGMTSWMLGAQLNMAAGLLVMVRSIRNVGSSGYDAGYYAGSQISLGFANGMLAYLGQINTAASLMVAAASRAVIAKAMISSPSRLFKQYGEYIGAGMEEGILGKVRDVGRASERMIGAALWTPETPSLAGASGRGQTVNHYHTTQVYTLTSDEWLAKQDEIADRASGQTIDMLNRSDSVVGGMI